jgi:methenyltetrahydrofolate cyclohydrolase
LRPDFTELTVGELLDQLASRTSVPAGGVVAALQAAQAAALLAMAARFSVRGTDAASDRLATEVAEAADLLRTRAVGLSSDDVAAFEAVKDAWSKPRGEERDGSVRRALAGAAEPPAAVVSVAREVVAQAGRLLPVVHRSVAADLAAAVDAAHAAASTSRRNVEVNLADYPDHALLNHLGDVDDLLGRAIDIGRVLRRGSRS